MLDGDVDRHTITAAGEALTKARDDSVRRMLGCWVSEIEPVAVPDIYGVPRVLVPFTHYAAWCAWGGDPDVLLTPVVGPVLTVEQEEAFVESVLTGAVMN